MIAPELGISLKGKDGEPIFAEPWQAQVLAMVDLLIQSGAIAPAKWTEILGAELCAAADVGEPNDADTYWGAVLSALEAIVVSDLTVTRAELARRRHEWEHAYLETPHGHPVELSCQQDGKVDERPLVHLPLSASP